MSLSLILRGGTVYDGDGRPGQLADVGIADGRIEFVGAAPAETSAKVLDVSGLIVTPGFINVLSQAWQSIQLDPTAASDTLQGVTTEVFGEAVSLGPSDVEPLTGPVDEPRVDFHRLSEGLDHIVRRGVVPNVASFVGGTNLRRLAAGDDDRPLSAAELDRLRGVLAEEMAEGALGLGTALIYAPGRFASTAELTSLCEVVADYDGLYVSHLRSETSHLLEALDELITIGRDAGCRAEVYHLKAGGARHHHLMKLAIENIEIARASGQAVSANMYPYVAGMTNLVAAIPPSFHAGGVLALANNLTTARADIIAALTAPETAEFENLLACAGGDGIRFLRDLPDGTPAAGRTLGELAAYFGLDDAEAVVEVLTRDLFAPAVFETVSEDNVELGLQQPWVSICSDAPAQPATPPWTEQPTHPRTYGAFARVVRRYVADRQVLSFTEAVRRMTSLPADTLHLTGRGRVRVGCFADVAVFAQDEVADHATFDDPHRYATGLRHLIINGAHALDNGSFTGLQPGRRLSRA